MTTAASTNKLLMIIIAVILPPLAVAMQSGLSSQFWICLLLTFLLYLPGLLYALYVIL
ncbi:YqaE/Pmp3 family membrane protein [Flavilitoribacter nigricans]|uniref:YqaE/Pmp3 family membrane protein n=1 Tax=Flavilitoribacter nigricans (strain ATCC 23147 / DSM 23189 / NBRC 102662 / NCIMB 1420 / SS-2) TaxID=1122177 RepID=A0A2D0NFN0_FLAN2|nr:YqaE/Pmp3 family membrane protein [Flavilitoribacter nigricans]PHN07295.1 YqaE/Pmp3 family membrane protein [Flavilitoribacter nigricans DSM 23189 = NBRC 102662]